jgi:hypothetical protein
MKVTCNHCGTKNELGRIFCMSCGKRMHITNDDVSQAVQEKRAFDAMTLVRPVILLVFLSLIAVALWPRTPFVPALDAGKKAEVRAKLVAKINSLVTAARGKQEASAVFDSTELGVYLEARQSTVAADRTPLTVRLEGNRMIALQQSFLGPFAVGGKTLGPFRFTRELSCEAVGKTFKVRGGSFGHLPLPGPLSALLVNPVAAAFLLTPAEQLIEKQLSEMNIQDGELELVVGP